MSAVKGFALLLVTAAVFFFLGWMYGTESVPSSEKFYENLIDGCHRFLEAGLDADFGRCIAGGRYNSN